MKFFDPRVGDLVLEKLSTAIEARIAVAFFFSPSPRCLLRSRVLKSFVLESQHPGKSRVARCLLSANQYDAVIGRTLKALIAPSPSRW